MSKAVEIGSTLAAVVAFAVLLALAGATGYEKVGTVAAILGFVLLSSGAGYLIARDTYF